MGVTVLFHTNNLWETHRILHSGTINTGVNLSLFADPYSHYIVGQHTAAFTLYNGSYYQICRLEMGSGIFAVVEYSNESIPYSVDGPTTSVTNAKIAHYLDEWGDELGTAYIEIVTSGYGNKGYIHYYEGYPIYDIGWDTTSGTGYYMNDIIGVDFPSSPRVLISTHETFPSESVGITVIEVNVASGMAYGFQASSYLDLPSGINITDLEAQRYL